MSPLLSRSLFTTLCCCCFKPPGFVNFYWNTDMLIHLLIVYGCFQDTTAEVSNCGRDHNGLQSLKYLLSGPLFKKKKKSVVTVSEQDLKTSKKQELNVIHKTLKTTTRVLEQSSCTWHLTRKSAYSSRKQGRQSMEEMLGIKKALKATQSG